MLLSQDPITRRLGDGATRLVDSLLSGDLHGVLAELGRDKDTNELSDENVRHLRNVMEELRDETMVRLNNAWSVIVALLDRIGASNQELVKGPLAERIIASPAFRWQLGIAGIRAVVEGGGEYERSTIVQIILSELIGGNEVTFELPNGIKPTLNDAIVMVKEGVELALDVWQTTKLPDDTGDDLLAWLEVRRIVVGKDSTNLSFTDLENWASRNGSWLLNRLSQRYVEAVLTEVESGKGADLDEDIMLGNCKVVIAALASVGTENNYLIAPWLPRFISSMPWAGVEYAYQFVDSHIEVVSTVAHDYIVAFAERLQSGDWRDTDDFSAAIQAFQRQIRLLRAQIDGSDVEHVVNLVIALGEDEDTAEVAADLLVDLKGIDHALLNEVIMAWSKELLTALPDKILEAVANEFDPLEADTKASIAAHFDIVARGTTDTMAIRRYARFVEALSDEAVSKPPMQPNAEAVVQYLVQRTNSTDEIRRYLPVIAAFGLRYCPATYGQLLAKLAVYPNNPLGTPFYEELHETLAAHWPVGKVGTLEPTTVAQACLAYLNDQPEADNAEYVHSTLIELRRDKSIGEDYLPAILESAINLWKSGNRQALEQTYTDFKILPTNAQLAEIAEHLDLNEPDNEQDLTKVWTRRIEALDVAGKVDVAKHLVAFPMAKAKGLHDVTLDLWINLVGDSAADVLSTLLLDSSLTDDQRHRMWAEVERRLETFGSDKLMQIIPATIMLADSPKTIRAIIDARSKISNLIKLSHMHLQFARALVAAFPRIQKNQTKNDVAEWIKDVAGANTFRGYQAGTELSKNDLEILNRHMQRSTILSKLLDRFKKQG